MTRRSLRHPMTRPTRTRPSAGQVFFCLMSTFCFVLILRNSDAAIEYLGRGLTLCARSVIPSLFPFMVISELLVSSGAGEAFGRIFARMMRWLFGLSGAGVSAVILGSMCGFPIGAKTAVSLLDRNMISKSECEHLLTFTSNPSSAFLITAVGVSLFGNRRLGVILYAIVLGTSFLVGFLARFFLRGTGKPDPHPHYPVGLHPGGVEMFTSAVSSAASNMLIVCAYVVFFSAIMGALGCVFNRVGNQLSGMPYVLLGGFLELSGGVSEASLLPDARTGMILAAAFAGWSGLSVHCQVMTLCAGRGLSLKPYVIAKLFQGILCAVCMAAVITFCDPAWLTPASDTVIETIMMMGWSLRDITVPALVTDSLFVTGWLISRVRGWRE